MYWNMSNERDRDSCDEPRKTITNKITKIPSIDLSLVTKQFQVNHQYSPMPFCLSVRFMFI